MPNLNAPWGLRPVGTVSGQPYTGSIRSYSVAAGDGTALYIGDPVKLAGTAQFINGQTFTNVARASTGDIMVGVVVAALADTRDSLIYRAASTQRVVLVADDPNALFEAQQVAGGTPLTANDIGFNINFTGTGGVAAFGTSNVALDNTTEAGTNTLDLKIIGMVNRVDNDPGTAVGTGADASRFLVQINRHQYVNQVAGV